MLDIHLIRNTPDIVRKDLKKRNAREKIVLVDKILKLDQEWRKLKQEVEALRHQRNVISQNIALLKKEGKKTEKEVKEAGRIPGLIQEKETTQEQIRQEMDTVLMQLPNILHPSVPVGKDDTENEVVKEFGKKPKFDFPVKNHVDILEQLHLVELERAAKISGARFWFLRGKLALLDIALQRYAIDFMQNKGYTLLHPPFMMNRKAYEGVTDLLAFEDVLYKIEKEDLYLIATSEHPLIAMFLEEIFEEKELPIKLCGISTCFRKEAGTHGKDTKGIFRGHQFNKVEQIILCKPEDSWKFHEELIKNAAEFFQSLEIPFRIVNVCTGDIGMIAAKKYDLEAWFPAQQAYREVVSCSNCTDYQARRLKIRYRTKEGNKIVHTLNATCVATSRALAAIIENFQQKDGSVAIPKVLQPSMQGLKKIGKED
ncbi:serine--tRNA ligase [Candidatus Woesearchaeota archaeon]|nr:serine--tRNA ligase [Candidatus Woesearchaeota archaeon]